MIRYPLLVMSLVAATATAAPTVHLKLEGRLLKNAGPPADDGDYVITVRLYIDGKQTGAVLWSETHLAVPVTDGLFAMVIGTTSPLTSNLFVTGEPLWVGVQVGSDPELPPEPLAYQPYAVHALRADLASDLECVGCVAPGELSPAVNETFVNANGDVMTGDLSTTGTVTAKGGVLLGAATTPCDAAHAGAVWYDAAQKRLFVCDGAASHALAMCSTKCPKADDEACGKVVTDLCGAPCGGIGTGLNLLECVLSAASTACGTSVEDSCQNPCGYLGSAPNPGLCPVPNAVSCGAIGTDPCGNPCTVKGVACGAAEICAGDKCVGLGGAAEAAALSCKQIHDGGVGIGSTAYWLDSDGDGGDAPFKAWCDMDTDGGGWTLVMKQSKNHGYGSPLAVNTWAGWSTKGSVMNAADASFGDGNMVNAAYSTLGATELRLTASQTWTDTSKGAWKRAITGTPFEALSNANANKAGNLGSASNTPWPAASFTDASWTSTTTNYALCWRSGPWFNQTTFEYTEGGIKWGWFFNNECSQSTTDTSEGLGCCGNSSWYRASPWTLYLWAR